MSDLLPTKEQEDAADAICTWIDDEFGSHRLGDVDAISLLLAEREAVLVDVICRLRSVMHEVVIESALDHHLPIDTHNEVLKALEETVQYEVVK